MKMLFNSARVLGEKGIFGVKEQVGIINLILSIRLLKVKPIII